METFPTASLQVERPVATSSQSSKCSQDDAALCQLITKDPVLGQVMKILMGKLNETNKKLDETNEKLDRFHTELRRDLDNCQDQVNMLELDIPVKMTHKVKPARTKTNHAVNAKKSEDEGREVSEDCLGISTILRRILEQFSNKELIELSLVNKLWNYEARSVMRDRGCLKATINLSPTCQNLVDFASDLRQMSVVPFTGISVSITHFGEDNHACQSLPIGSLLDPPYQVILDKLSWKHLSIEFRGDWWQFKDCPALVLVKRILEDYCGVLEEFSISNYDHQIFEFFGIESIFRSRSFSLLKTLKVHRQSVDTLVPNSFMRALVASAPNLQKFCMNGLIEFNENVMEGSSAVLVAATGFRPLNEQVCESLIEALRTETIDVYCRRFWGFDVELLNMFVPMVIQASRTTLKTLRMDLLFAVPLMCYGIRLENVTELGIFTTEPTVGRIQPHILALVKSFDFTRVFPKLNKVNIFDYHGRDFSVDDIIAFVERGSAVARTSLPDRTVNIRHLEFSYSRDDSTPPLIFLAELFPHVKTVSLKTKALQEFPFTLLWKHFSRLAELHVDFDGLSSSMTTNLDSVFCGIFPEEVDELREKDDEYLKGVNIVPVMPSIACMRGLRLFTLRYGSRCCNNSREDSTRILSKVTGLIGFPRCPTLSVKFRVPSNSPEVNIACTGSHEALREYRY